MIIVPTDSPGYEIVGEIPTMGDTSGAHCEIRLTDVRVPAGNLLGPRGQAFKIAQARLGPGRIYHCMRWLGQAQRAFDLMCKRALAREAFGERLADKQTVQNWVADSAAEIQAARLMTLDAAQNIDSGDDARVEIALIKFFGAKVLHDVIDRAIQVHGALGVSGDTPLERMYRHARYARIYDGPDEVHRDVGRAADPAPLRVEARPTRSRSSGSQTSVIRQCLRSSSSEATFTRATRAPSLRLTVRTKRTLSLVSRTSATNTSS